MVLRVRACTDALVTLTTVPGNPNAQGYQVVLGTDMNTRSVLRDGVTGQELAVSFVSIVFETLLSICYTYTCFRVTL